jgi:hypothetical protein
VETLPNQAPYVPVERALPIAAPAPGGGYTPMEAGALLHVASRDPRASGSSPTVLGALW